MWLKQCFPCALWLLVCASAHAANVFQDGGCVSLAEYEKYKAAVGAHDLATFKGNSDFIQLLEDYRFTLSMYGTGAGQRVVVSLPNMPIGRRSENQCILFLSDGTHNALSGLGPDAPAVSPWDIPTDVAAVRKYCADKIIPAMIGLYNNKQRWLDGVWVTSTEEHMALAKIAGVNLDEAKARWEKPDVDRLAKAHEAPDGECSDFGTIQGFQKKRGRKLAMMVAGNHLKSTGKSFTPGALAVFVPSSTATKAQRGWTMFMVFRDGRAYELGDGDSMAVQP